MKKSFLFFVLFSFSILSFAQDADKYAIKATKLKDPSQKFLYTYVDNELLISAKGVQSSKLIVSINKGEISGANGKYIVKIAHKNMERTNKFKLKVSYLKTAKDTVLLGITEFLGYGIQDPIPSIAGNKGGMITKEDLLKADSLSLETPDNYLKETMTFKISSFMVSYSIGYIKELNATGSLFTTEQKAFFNTVKPNQKIYIENIKAKDNLGMVRCLPTLVFKIAE